MDPSLEKPDTLESISETKPTASSDVDVISVGDYIIIQRQKYTKLYKFNGLDSTAMLSKDLIELRSIAGHPYSSTFRMLARDITDTGNKRRGNKQKTMQLERCSYEELSQIPTEALAERESGIDNRDIIDDGESQTLSAEEIERLRLECKTSTEIVSQIVENSKSFINKTEYSQEKYLKKKEKKYFEFLQIKRPNLRLITEVMFRQCPEKILGLRMDSISQILSYCGISAVGNHLVYESGTNGLLPAALINSIGSNTDGKLVHMHPGNVPQKQALFALNLEKEQLDRCISVNIYSILRHYYQNICGGGDDDDGKVLLDSDSSLTEKPTGVVSSEDGEQLNCGTKRKVSDLDSSIEVERPMKILKTNNKNEGVNMDEKNVVAEIKTVQKQPINQQKNKQEQQWMLDNVRAVDLLKNQMDSLVICAKEHPLNILKALLPFIKPSRPIVVFSLSRELLMEMYVDLKTNSEVTNLRITSNWLRTIQVLPNRTHPDVSMSANSGFLLTGIKVQ